MTRLPLRALASVRMRLLGALASLLLLAVLAAGCGGGGGGRNETTSAQDWADGVCSAINTWTDSLRSAGQSLRGGNLSESSLTGATDDLKDATAQLKDDLSGLGAPDTESGDKAKQTTDDLSNNIQEGVDTIEGAVKDATDGGGIVSAVTTVTSTLSTMGSQVQMAFGELEKLDPGGELESAFKDASSCKSLTSQQG
jgi:hypothetical protein